MRAKKVDTTHGEIAAHLRSIGLGVSSTAAIGRGFPDLLVAYQERAALVECKTGSGKRNAAQIKFAAEWPGIVVEARTGLEAEQKIKAAWADFR